MNIRLKAFSVRINELVWHLVCPQFLWLYYLLDNIVLSCRGWGRILLSEYFTLAKCV